MLLQPKCSPQLVAMNKVHRLIHSYIIIGPCGFTASSWLLETLLLLGIEDPVLLASSDQTMQQARDRARDKALWQKRFPVNWACRNNAHSLLTDKVMTGDSKVLGKKMNSLGKICICKTCWPPRDIAPEAQARQQHHWKPVNAAERIHKIRKDWAAMLSRLPLIARGSHFFTTSHL